MEQMYRMLLAVIFLSAGLGVHGYKFNWKRADYYMDSLQDQEEAAGDKRKLFFNANVPDEVTITKAGESIVLNCEAGGSPSPTIHWLHNGDRITERQGGCDDGTPFTSLTKQGEYGELDLGQTHGRLYMDCLTTEDAGEYTCVAETPFQRIHTSTALKVDGSAGREPDASCLMKSLDVGSPARICMFTSTRLEFEGTDVRLFCRAGGSPNPKVTWYDPYNHRIKEGQDHGKHGQYSVLENGDLIIREITFAANMGSYRCVAETPQGTDEEGSFLYATAP